MSAATGAFRFGSYELDEETGATDPIGARMPGLAARVEALANR